MPAGSVYAHISSQKSDRTYIRGRSPLERCLSANCASMDADGVRTFLAANFYGSTASE